MDQPVDRLVGGQHTGQRDHHDHEQAAEILGPPVAVGVALGCGSPGQPERDQQRHGRQRVRDVVQRVTQQRHRPGQHDDNCLDGCGEGEAGQAEQQRAPTRGVGLQRVIDLVGRVMRMTAEQLRHAMPRPRPHRRVVHVAVPMVAVPMVVIDVLTMRMRAWVGHECPCRR